MHSSPISETALKNEMNSSILISSPLSSSPSVPSTAENTGPIQPSNSKSSTRPLSEIIGEIFPPFDHLANIVTPFNDEANRDLAFERVLFTSTDAHTVSLRFRSNHSNSLTPSTPLELSSMLLDVILETHAWSSARPKHESTLAANKIEQKIVTVMEAEKEQEKTRERLNEFVTRIRTALAALTGLGI